MTPRRKAISVGLVLAVVFAIVIGSQTVALSQSLAIPQPTRAPTPTPGKPLPEQIRNSVANRPIDTAAEAVAVALEYGSQHAEWAEPWSIETLQTDPGRIQVREFASRTEESADAGRGESYGPEQEAEAGGVWRVTIQGEVKTVLPGIGVDPNATYERVTYVFSKRTGNLLAVIADPIVK